MILIIDHYDSFSQSLYQLVRKCCQETEMIRSDQATVEEIRQMKPQMIILSTGAGKPEEAGVFLETVKELGSQIPILGIGLGYLAVCSAFGGRLKERENPVCGQWEDFVSTAPKDQIVSAARPTEEQKALGLKKTAAANEMREKRTDAMFHKERAEAVVTKYGYSREIFDLLFESRGNLDRLLAFLEDGDRKSVV